MEEFNAALKSRIESKQAQYDALLANLSSGTLPAVVVSDIGVQMQELKDEIAALRDTQPPKDFTVETIKAWLKTLKANPDEKAVHLLVERIDVKQDRQKEKTEFSITSTLNSVLGIHGCGGRI